MIAAPPSLAIAPPSIAPVDLESVSLASRWPELARLAESLPRPSRPGAFARRVNSARAQAARRGKRSADAAVRAIVSRAPGEPMNAGAARALARALARQATDARSAAFDQMADVLQDHAERIAVASAEENGHALRVPPRDRRPSPQEIARIRARIRGDLNRASRSIPRLRARLAERLERALTSSNPAEAVARVVRSPLDPRRLATLPAMEVLVRARDLGTVAAGKIAGIGGYRFVAVLDSRTTTVCRSAHGRVMAAGDVARSGATPHDPDQSAPAGAVLVPPIHRMCRSRLVPMKTR